MLSINVMANPMDRLCSYYINDLCPEDPQWSSCDERLLSEYTRMLYEPLNKHLRGLKIEKACDTMARALNLTLEKMQSTGPLTVYRGTPLRKSMAALKAGDCYSDLGFISTSEIKEGAEGFAYSDSKDRLIMEIKSYSGKVISRYSGFQREKEILFKPQTIFKLESRSKDNQYNYFKMKEVSEAECKSIKH